MSIINKIAMSGLILLSQTVLAKDSVSLKVLEVIPGKICLLVVKSDDFKTKEFGLLSSSCSQKVANTLIGEKFNLPKKLMVKIQNKELLAAAKSYKKMDYLLVSSIKDFKKFKASTSQNDDYQNSGSEDGLKCETYENCEDLKSEQNPDAESDFPERSGDDNEFPEVLF